MSRQFFSSLFIGIGLSLMVATRSSADEQTSGGVESRPPRVMRHIEGWTVHVDPKLVEGKHAAAGEDALEMLRSHLQRIRVLMPSETLRRLRTIEIWIDHQHPKLEGLQYHPSAAWLADNGHDAALAKKVHICRAAQLLEREELLKHPAAILHELAHGYHDQILGFEHPGVLDAFRQSQKDRRYEDVLLYTGARVRHYGLTNHKEYFAEGTEAFFYRNDFYPFVRAELKEHDPALHQLLHDVWGVTER